MKIKSSIGKCISIGFTLYTLVSAIEVINNSKNKIIKTLKKMFKKD